MFENGCRFKKYLCLVADIIVRSFHFQFLMSRPVPECISLCRKTFDLFIYYTIFLMQSGGMNKRPIFCFTRTIYDYPCEYFTGVSVPVEKAHISLHIITTQGFLCLTIFSIVTNIFVS